MKKYATEFIGTFFLMFTIILTGNPLAIGAVLMVMVYAGGHISGAHYNPAVTFAVLIRKRIGVNEAIVYIVVQIAAAAAAALLSGLFKEIPGSSSQDIDTTKALLAEVLGTLALAYVVLNVATAKATSGNSYYGLAIGFTVLAMAYTFSDHSGGAFNPAVAFGNSVVKAFDWSNFWIYIVACFAGGGIAAIIFKMNNPDDK